MNAFSAAIVVPMDSPDDHKVLMLRVARSRDRDAFRSLFTHFAPRVKALMIKSGSEPAQAEDIAQDVMATVWRKIDLYTPERGSVGAWIFTIARNSRIDRLRRRPSQAYEDVEALDLEDGSPDGEDEVFAQQRAKLVGEALGQLPDEQKQVMELSFLQDMTQMEISEKLSVPLGTVKSRMRLAYGKLRTTLEDLR